MIGRTAVTATEFLERATRGLFFTGKGGVGKTSLACATAVARADRGKKVLLVSTGPASNLDEAIGQQLTGEPRAVPAADGVFAVNIDPEAAAKAHRERVVGPYRGVLPDAAIQNMEEELSGACTVEIAAFDEFTRLLGDEAVAATYDHIIFDTAPTGHTLRLLKLPGAWTGFMKTKTTGASCLGPFSGLPAQRSLYESSLRALSDGSASTLILVSHPEPSALAEAGRTSGELAQLGAVNQRLVLNGLIFASDATDPAASALEARGRSAIDAMPKKLADLRRLEVPLLASAPMGIQGLRAVLERRNAEPVHHAAHRMDYLAIDAPLSALIDEIEQAGRGVVITMGRGGMGKTTVASAIALELARRGRRVHLSTTDPAARLASTIGMQVSGLKVSRIDPAAETARCTADVMAKNAPTLDDEGKALLEENLRSPCTGEIAVFSAFAHTMAEGEDGFVVQDTAPTGHTLLLLVALPEATPVHEAARLQEDLLRAGIEPFAWVVNQSLAGGELSGPVLRERGFCEATLIAEVRDRLAGRMSVIPWAAEALTGPERLLALVRSRMAAALSN